MQASQASTQARGAVAGRGFDGWDMVRSEVGGWRGWREGGFGGFLLQEGEDGAGVDGSVPAATRGQIGQCPAERLEVGDASIELGELFQRAGTDRGTGRPATSAQLEQGGHVREGEAQRLGPADEAQSLHRVVRVGAVPDRGTIRLGEQALPLVEPDRLDGDSGFPSECADGEPGDARGHLGPA